MQQQQATAIWNPTSDRWETGEQDIFGHSVVYAETFPKSGTTRAGLLYESPTSEDAITAPESFCWQHLPTPTASEWKREDNPSQARRKSPSLTTVSVHFPQNQEYLPTPDASMGQRGAQKSTSKFRPSGHRRQIKLNDIPSMLPTPNTMDSLPVREGEARKKQLHRGDLNSTERRFMGNIREDIVHETSTSTYGVYEAAVHRWEQVTRPAPEPTTPNSKGKPQLNAAFAEWMMGLPDGWVTSPDIGITRAQQLKAIGNGVCPQQAATALTYLLNDIHET